MNDQSTNISSLQAVQWHAGLPNTIGFLAPTPEVREAVLDTLMHLLGMKITPTLKESPYPRAFFPDLGDGLAAKISSLLQEHGIPILPNARRAELSANNDPTFQIAKASREAAEKEAELAATRALEAAKASAKATCLQEGAAWYSTRSGHCGLFLKGEPSSELLATAARLLTAASYLPETEEAILSDPAVVREGLSSMGKTAKTIEKFAHLGIDSTHASDGVFVELSNPNAAKHLKATLEAAEITIHPGRIAAQTFATKSSPSLAVGTTR